MSVLSSGVLTKHVHCFVLSSELSSCLMLEKKKEVFYLNMCNVLYCLVDSFIIHRLTVV